jgi:hypothetical protein
MIERFLKSHSLPLQLVVAGVTGLLWGVISLRFSPLWTFIALSGGGLILATLKRPEIALLGILVCTSSVVFESALPLVPIGVGSLHVPDLLLLALFGLIVLRWLVEPDFKIIRTPLDWPLLCFYGVSLLSTCIAVYQSSLEFDIARREIRVATYYLSFFIVTNLVREDCQLRLLLRGLFVLASIVAAAMVVQFLLGASLPFLPGSVYTLLTADKSYSGVTRIIPPGHSLVMVSFVTTASLLISERLSLTSILCFLRWGLVGLALVLTFLRSYWAVAGVLLLLLALLVTGQSRRRLIGWGLVIAFLTAMLVLAALRDPASKAARLLMASSERLATLGSGETLGEGSLEWRYLENSYALSQIPSRPLLGLGMGARYRPFDPRLDQEEGWDARRFIHNGHLWVLLNMGVLGYLCLMWLSVTFLIRGSKSWRTISDHWMKGIVLGFTLVYLGLLIAAVVNSIFASWSWTPVIGIMMGVNEVALRRAVQEKSGSVADSGRAAPQEV